MMALDIYPRAEGSSGSYVVAHFAAQLWEILLPRDRPLIHELYISKKHMHNVSYFIYTLDVSMWRASS